MSAMRSLVLVPVLLAASLAPALALAVSDDNPYKDIILNRKPTFDYDESKAPKWQEQEIRAPELYNKHDLGEVAITRIQKGFSVLIDKKRLNIGPDGVLRYWVVLKSDAGAVNATYEGMRCSTYEYKDYAFSVDGRTVQPMKDAQWHKIHRALGNNFQYELMDNYFCYYGHPRPVEQIVKLIEQGPEVGPTRDTDLYY